MSYNSKCQEVMRYLFKIHFYKDSKGNQPVKDYILQLKRKNGKDSRIKVTKIQDYIKVLQRDGTRAGEPYVKHIEGDLWELRPIDDRIFFVVWKEESFVLLHQFRKKTQKTPQREIDKAKREIEDLKKRGL